MNFIKEYWESAVKHSPQIILKFLIIDPLRNCVPDSKEDVRADSLLLKKRISMEPFLDNKKKEDDNAGEEKSTNATELGITPC